MPLKTVARGAGGGGGGSGTVTSVNVSGGATGLTTTGGPITTAGEITIGGALNIANGGTGQTSKTAAFDALAPTTTKGDLVVYDGTDNIRLAVGTNGYYLKADSTTGSGLAWDSVAAGGVTSVTATAPLASSGGATPDISLTGIVPIANGGTGETTDVAAFDALAPTTTKGDIIVFDGSDNIRLGVGAHSYVLTADSTTASGLTWASVGGGGSGTTTYAVTFNNGGTGDASGTTFDGSVARTISYNTFGAANSGANTNITSLDSITGGISSPDYVQFDTTATVTGAVGKLWYDNGDGTLVTQLKGGNVDLQIGQENVVLAYNNSGTTINKGQVVAVNGAQGQRPAVVLADADSEPLSAATLGVANESIGAGAEGFVATFGTIRGINTNGFTAGDPVYLSQTAGAFTSTRPSAPAHTVFLGWIVKVNSSSGELFLNINNGWELDELHNVLITSPANGDLLQYDSAGPYWENVAASNVTVGSATSAGSVTNAVTFNTSGGAAANTTYNGSVARTIDYSTVGAPKADGTGASGTWNISILGSAGSATTATTATNLSGGTANQLAYQTGAGATSFVTAASGTNTFLKWSGSAFSWSTIAEMTYPGAGIPNSTGAAWGTSYTTTGTGTVVALATSPSFTTPSLGVATATSVNKVTITAPATGSTLTIADGKTATINNTITLAGTDATTMTFPATSTTVAGLGIAQTFTQDQTIAGNLIINAQGDVRFADGDSSNWVAFQGPATVASNVTWTLPSADGTSGQVLSTNGTGTLSWSSVSGSPGGSNTQIQFNNSGAFGGSANLTWDGTNVQLGATGALRFADTDSSNYVAFKSPGTVSANVTWTLPSTDGSSGQFLSTDGSGTLSWATGGGGGGSSVILENQRTISSNYTITDGYNGLSVGPVTVNTNVTVTVGTDERWVVMNF